MTTDARVETRRDTWTVLYIPYYTVTHLRHTGVKGRGGSRPAAPACRHVRLANKQHRMSRAIFEEVIAVCRGPHTQAVSAYLSSESEETP